MKNEKRIYTLKGLEGIQMRPSMYIGDVTSYQGLHNLFLEVIFNSIDEYMNGHCNELKVKVTNSGSVVVTDNGRGIPIEENEDGHSLINIFTKIHSGGKFYGHNYKYSSGMHGVGLSAVNALSKYLLCSTYDQANQQSKIIIFKNGSMKSFRTQRRKMCGTSILFKPHPAYFSNVQWNKQVIEESLNEISMLNPGLKIELDYLNTRQEYNNKDDTLQTMMCYLNNKPELHNIYVNGEISTEKIKGRFCLKWVHSNNFYYLAYTNHIKQIHGGTHVNGILSGVRGFVQKFLKHDLDLKDIRRGMCLVVEILVKDPQFNSQVKDKLVSSWITNDIQNAILNTLSRLPLDRIRKLIKDLRFKKQQIESVKLTEESIKPTDKMLHLNNLPGKLIDCLSRDTLQNELILAEGDSAAGGIKQVRDKQYQAVLALKGKLINSIKNSLKKTLSFATIKDIIFAIGTGINDQFHIDKVRYGKVIIMTDADKDGLQIRCLIISFFVKFMPGLIEDRRLYIGAAPLYTLRLRGRRMYFIDDYELDRYLSKNVMHVKLYNKYNRLKRMLGVNVQVIKPLEDQLQDPKCPVRFGRSFIVKDPRPALRRVIRIRFNHISKALCYFYAMKRIFKYEYSWLDTHNHLSNLRSKHHITMNKGLGEMNPDELWEYVIDRNNRTLYRIELNDYHVTERIMGVDTRGRKDIIRKALKGAIYKGTW